MNGSQRVIAGKEQRDLPPAVGMTGTDGGTDMPDIRNQVADTQGEPLISTLYKSAVEVVRQEYSDPSFDPRALVNKLHCSRASLYRTFAANGQTVAGMIWSVRLDSAWRMLASGDDKHLLLADVALRCGFADQSTFSRMFKRRYGISPREARALSA